LDRSGL